MKSILNLFSLDTIITFLLRALAGITSDQFKQAQEHVMAAEKAFPAKDSGGAKKAWAQGTLKIALGKIATFALNLLIEMALASLVKKGLIK